MKYEEYRSMLDGLGYRMREVVLKDVANDPEQAASSLRLWLEANNGDLTDIVEMIEGARLNRRQQMLLDRIREDGKA